MAFRIPITREIDDTGSFEQQVTLEGTTYTLRFRWNVRMAAWVMHVLSADGATVHQAGLVLRANFPLGLYLPDRSPPGYFVVADTSAPIAEGQDPDLDALGSSAQLFYFTLAELS
jgi:hypothetical protein